MILFMLVACAIAKINRYRIKPIWKDASLYPFFAVECVYWVFQVCAFAGNYMFLPYAGFLQSAFIISMLFPILRHRLYAKAIVGTGMVFAGSLLNKLVMNYNGGRMPVWPTLSKFTGYFNPQALTNGFDALHTLMGGNSALNFLGDYIDVGYSIMSPGDLLIHGFTTVIIYGVIKNLNKSSSGGD
jgi:hypothetical protein